MTQPDGPGISSTRVGVGGFMGRWARELTQNELKRALNAPRFEIAVWEAAGVEFICVKKMNAIIRTAGSGGDVYDVHGGWQYSNGIALLQDWTEIKSVATRVQKWDKDGGIRDVPPRG